MDNDKQFEFGKNWQKFLKLSFSVEALDYSKNKLSQFLNKKSLEGETFVDLGCGSGIHSLSALELGASKVISIDFQEDSVECAKGLRSDFSYGDRWEIYQGSILDDSFLKKLGTFSIVYCWGVAHHTGGMWQALSNISTLVGQNGLIFIAIYNYLEGRRGSRMWWKIKNLYNKSPLFVKKIMEYFYISWNFLKLILHPKNPFKVIMSYKKKRGMSWKTDLIDWLGGFPYEYASVQQIFDFYKKRDFDLVNIQTTNYIGCNQFLFKKK